MHRRIWRASQTTSKAMVDQAHTPAELKCLSFAQSAKQFAELSKLDLQETTKGLANAPLILDGLQNGLAQKFELTTELCWKAIKSVLLNQDGIDEASPKKVIKAFFLAEYVSQAQYLDLIAAVDDRNKLSHIYDAEQFMAIIDSFPRYAALYQNIAKLLLAL